jgi:hypothetical protein
MTIPAGLRDERRVAEDQRLSPWGVSAEAGDSNRLYVVTNSVSKAGLQEPVKDPGRSPWHEVTRVQHYWLEVDAMTKPMTVREDSPLYGRDHDS